MKTISRDNLLLGIGRTCFLMKLAKANIEGLTLGLSKSDQISMLGVCYDMIAILAQEQGFTLEECENAFEDAKKWATESPEVRHWSPNKFYRQVVGMN